MLWIYLVIAYTVVLIFVIGFFHVADRAGPSQTERSRPLSSASWRGASSSLPRYKPFPTSGGEHADGWKVRRIYVRGEVYLQWAKGNRYGLYYLWDER